MGKNEEIGKESSLELYIEHLVALFDALKEKLTSSGTAWINLGDTYIGKELQGAPWKVALALQQAGWILRNDVIWQSFEPPSSVKDRLTVDLRIPVFLCKEQGLLL